jgi:hypothetical protein
MSRTQLTRGALCALCASVVNTEYAGGLRVIVMDRENLWARGWSHVLSTTNDVAELLEFCDRVGAPSSALHLANRRWPHLDLTLLPRQRALDCADVRVFERTSEMLRYLKSLNAQLPEREQHRT